MKTVRNTLESLIASTLGAIRPAEKLSVSEWASKHRYLNNPGSFVGYWDHDKTPYMREPIRIDFRADHDPWLAFQWAPLSSLNFRR